MFEAEALGLSAMYETQTIRVPKPFKVGKFSVLDALMWQSFTFYFSHDLFIKLQSIL